MTNKQLRAFLAVARSLSFAQASEQLHLSQPALSLTIKSLETDLGGQLFTRTTRSTSLTPEGEAFLPVARQLLADWDNAEERMRQHFTLQLGKVSIAAMPSFAANQLPFALRAFREKYPNVNVAVHDVINERMLEMVRDARVELGIGFEPDEGDTLRFTPLSEGRFVAVVPAAVMKTLETDRHKHVSWATLRHFDFITLQRPSSVRALIEARLNSVGHELTVALECHQLVTVGRMVALGMGVSAVPDICVGQMEELGACCLPLKDPVIKQRIGLLRRADRHLSTAAQALHDVVIQTKACL
jgi:LysR family carnitine catabolism transcriptional activator